jgi:hypothetical protein
MRAYEFSIARSWHRELNSLELAGRLRQFSPGFCLKPLPNFVDRMNAATPRDESDSWTLETGRLRRRVTCLAKTASHQRRSAETPPGLTHTKRTCLFKTVPHNVFATRKKPMSGPE